MRPTTRLRLVAAVAATLSASPALAADFTWNGNGPDALWGTGANWQGGTAPPPASELNNLIFGSSTTALNPLIDDPYTVGRISFQANPGYDLGLTGDGSLRIVGGGGFGTTGIFASFTAGGMSPNPAGSTSTISAPFTSDGGLIYADTSVAAGTIALAGNITSTGSGTNSQGQTFGFGKIGPGRLILVGTNSFANGFEARNGVIGLAGDGAAGADSQVFGVTTGNTVTLYNPTAATTVNVAPDLRLGEATTATVKTVNFGLFTAQLTTYGLAAGAQGNLTFNGSVSQVSSAPLTQQVRLDARTGVTTTFNGSVSGNRYNKVGGGVLVFGPTSDASGVATYDAVSGVTVVTNATGFGQNLLHGSVDGQPSNLAVPTGSSVTLAQPAVFTASSPTVGKAIVLGAPGYNGAIDLAGPITLTGLNTVAATDTSVKPIGVSDNTLATISGTISSDGGNFGVTKFGNGSLTLSGINTYTGFTGVSSGALNISDNRNLGGVAGFVLLTTTGTLRTTAPVTSARQILTNSTLPTAPPPNFVPGRGTVDTNGFDSTFGPVLLSGTAATGEFVKAGAGTLTVTRSSTTGVTVNAGTLRYSQKATPNLPSGASRIVALAVAPGAALDVTNNLVVVDTLGREATPTTPAVAGTSLETVRSLLFIGRAGGAWNGPGINSSTIAASPASDAIGYVRATQVGTTFPIDFLGVSIGLNDVLLALTLAGDTDLSLDVGFPDLVRLAQNYNTPAGATWFDGDFDYDGAVGFPDLVALAQNYNGSLTDAAGVVGAGSFVADWALAQSLVPEPTLVLGAAAALGVTTRRRRA